VVNTLAPHVLVATKKDERDGCEKGKADQDRGERQQGAVPTKPSGGHDVAHKVAKRADVAADKGDEKHERRNEDEATEKEGGADEATEKEGGADEATEKEGGAGEAIEKDGGADDTGCTDTVIKWAKPTLLDRHLRTLCHAGAIPDLRHQLLGERTLQVYAVQLFKDKMRRLGLQKQHRLANPQRAIKRRAPKTPLTTHPGQHGLLTPLCVPA
jgi:hypothetical protein